MFVVVVVVEDEIGAALAQPPKSSSAVTLGFREVEALPPPQPAPMSLGVSVSGTFIIEDAAGSGAGGSGSGVSQALPPQGSMLAEKAPAGTAGAGAGAAAGLGAGCGAGCERLKADCSSSCGDGTSGFGGDCFGGEVVDVGGGDERPNRSLEKDGWRRSGFILGDVKLLKPCPKPFEETEVRD